MLRLSIDAREDNDLEALVSQLPFVIEQDLADQYGAKFLVSLDSNKMPVVSTQK